MIGTGELALIFTITILLFVPEFLDRKRSRTVHRLGLYAVIALLLLVALALSKLALRLLSVIVAFAVLVTAMALVLIKCLTRRLVDHDQTKCFRVIDRLFVWGVTLGWLADRLQQGFLRQCPRENYRWQEQSLAT